MKAHFLILLLLGLCLHADAQSGYITEEDPQHESVIFKGACTFADLEREPSFTWLGEGQRAYRPDSTHLAFLAQKLPAYELVVLMGTWCEDSRQLLPGLYRVLQEINFPAARIHMYGVDRQKQSAHGEHLTYGVTRVPAIIVLKDGKETGRITETVATSIEGDLADILARGK